MICRGAIRCAGVQYDVQKGNIESEGDREIKKITQDTSVQKTVHSS